MTDMPTSVPTSVAVPAVNGGEAVVASKNRGPRLSFASVAALAVSRPSAVESTAMPVTVGNLRPLEKVRTLPGEDVDEPPAPLKSSADAQQQQALRDSVARLHISGKQGPIIASADTDEQTPVSENLRFDDEKTHLSFVSNPTVSTDVRSVVSGTTFAMDEKESIRPDESASVKAAEEDDSTSNATSNGQQSLAGSEAGKAFSDQFNEISGVKQALPLTTNLVQRMPDETGRTGSSATAMAHVCPPPDEKLVEALQSQRDRMFLLQMEQQVIAFVKNSREQVLHLPPSNAFCRLLAHRLADYYNLTHAAEPSGSVRVGKSDNARLPPPLNEIANQQATSQAPAPQQPALKIMRRKDRSSSSEKLLAGGGFVLGQHPMATASSPSLSQQQQQEQAAFDQGYDASSPAKDNKRLTLEERSAKYNARREELYKDVPDKQKSGDDSTGASRASSALGASKKKKQFHKNDDFEPRSVYMGYPNSHQQGYTYANRGMMQPSYNFPQSANMTPASDTSSSNYDQMGNQLHQQQHQHQQAPGPDTAKSYGVGYGQQYPQHPHHSHAYYDPNYANFNLPNQQQENAPPYMGYVQGATHQQPLPMPQYTSAHTQGQQVAPYQVPQHDASFGGSHSGGYNASQMPGALMYPHNFATMQQSAFSPLPHQQIGPYPAQIYIGPAAPSPMHAAHQLLVPPPPPLHQPMTPMYMPVNEGVSGSYVGNQAPMYNGGMAPMAPTMAAGNSSPMSQATFQSNGSQQSPQSNSATSHVHRVGKGDAKPWQPSAKKGPAARDNTRTDQFVVPRQDMKSSQGQRKTRNNGQLKKYDTSTLPPKPPAPESPGQGT